MRNQTHAFQKHHFLIILTFLLLSPLVGAQTEHVLAYGETLYSVARTYGLSVDVLQSYNRIDDPRKLVVGQTLLIPNTYSVQKGDTLYGIARRLDATVAELYRLNNLEQNAIIKPGQILIVPGSAVTTIAASSQSDTSDRLGADKDPDSTETVSPGRQYLQPEWPVDAEAFSVDDRLSGAALTAKRGDPVVAVATGTVIWNAPFRGYGWMIIIESADRYVYVYGGNEQALVKVGDRVAPGTEIARLGTNPHSGEATLYFSVYRGGKIVDPAKAPRI